MRHKPWLLPLVFLACAKNDVPPPVTTAPPPLPATAATQVANAEPAPVAPVAATVAPSFSADAASSSINRLAQDLYGKLARTEKNLFYSPTSLEVALTMAYVGARGDTAAQMAKTLHVPLGAAVAPAFASVLSGLEAPAPRGGEPELSVANRLYGQKGFPFAPDFLAVQAEEYKAPLELVDFTGGDVAHTINDWVSQKTHGKIADLIPAGALTPLTRLVLVNAIYFKGAWLVPFRPEATQSEPFFGKSGTKATPLMHAKVHAPYAETKEAQILELLYAGGRLALDVVLPKTKDGLGPVEGAIASEGFARFTGGLEPRAVEVALPRFTIKTRFEASRVLSELGMVAAFQQDTANFRGMTTAEPLHIDMVFHEAFVDVNEAGTEAAAATGVVMAARGLRIEPPPTVFRADHPFVFSIRDTRSGVILFAGRMGDAA